MVDHHIRSYVCRSVRSCYSLHKLNIVKDQGIQVHWYKHISLVLQTIHSGRSLVHRLDTQKSEAIHTKPTYAHTITHTTVGYTEKQEKILNSSIHANT